MSEAVSTSQLAAATGQKDSVSSPRPLRVLVAASGTGGHLIPALQIMQALQRAQPDGVIEAIGTGKPLEEKVIVSNGFVRHIVSAAAIKQRGPLGILRFLCTLPKGVLGCMTLFRRRQPDVVVGVGGYVSVLPVIVARLMGIPTWIHEAELHLGLANRALSFFADRISISFGETKVRGRAKPVFTGHPVRPELRGVNRSGDREGAPSRLLVLGGSQGARGLDTVISEIAPLLHDRGVEVVHQCRAENMELVVNSYRAAKVKASVVPFIEDMAGAYEWSDLIISRAGASSVAEIACVNRPAILVPYPFQQGTHQTDNARSLADAGKAVVLEETEAQFAVRLRETLARLLDPVEYKEMKKIPSEPRGLGAADAIAQGIIALTPRLHAPAPAIQPSHT
jgi:UDP-N-acetylglucosamine--N-acetylmuramyl-(pentapeptide) pyrophosphoryl-undecaprenol N-acetylglucosamine transferase